MTTIAAGANHSLALCTDGTLASWGDNISGQIGDNTSTDRLIPVAVNYAAGISALSGKTVTSISAGDRHSVATCSDGSAAAWGNNAVGQLGDNTQTNRSVPVAVDTTNLGPSERFIRIASGVSAGHTLAIVAGPRLTPLESWRQAWFNSTANGGSAADMFDFDKDGLVNLIEHAFGLDPTRGSSAQLPQGQRVGDDFVIGFTRPEGASSVTYGAEWSTTLSGNPADWTAITDSDPALNGFTFSAPASGATQLFMRLTVAAP